ncbi:MAG: Tol-Pal system protein TolB [Rickettsiaceae bacterium]|nr:Tol-Pal system protein TolB [Rickettsiaceae bacterium]
MKKFTIWLVLIFSSLKCYGNNNINITQGNAAPIPVAVNHFVVVSKDSGTDRYNQRLSRKIVKVLQNDFRISGIFKPISAAAFIEKKIGVNHAPLFAAWQQINAVLLVNGEMTVLSSGKIRIKYKLYDTFLEREVLSETIELYENLWRRSAHKIADNVYKYITGYEGYFNTRIVYVSETGPYLKRTKRIAIMDQDGANHRYLTDGSSLVLTPRFSPDNKNILYLSYKNHIPQVYIMNLDNKRTRLIGNYSGMSFAPHFSPDGKKAVMSIAKNGLTHIYEVNLKNRKTTKLTRGFSINTSPSYSPDGKYIIFNSNRDGTRQLYVMKNDGTDIRRISFATGAYAEPSWSSNGYIAFTKMSRDYGFTIGVTTPDLDSDNYSERLISSGYLVESPSWANNGRVIAFTKGYRPRKNKSKQMLSRIYTIDFTGRNERIIPTPKDASDPDWSKPLD